MNVTIHPESGWFASLPKATQDFVMRKLTKAQTDRNRPVNLRVTGRGALRAHFAEPRSQARLDHDGNLGSKLAHDMRHVPAWRGASEGR